MYNHADHTVQRKKREGEAGGAWRLARRKSLVLLVLFQAVRAL
jgi:hypothetical protein